MATIINNWCDEKLLEVLKTKNGRIWNPVMETKLQRLQQKGCNYGCDYLQNLW
jgi:hypothetical protein